MVCCRVLGDHALDDSLRSAPKVFTGAADMFPKVFAAAKYAAMPDVSPHAPTGLGDFGATRLHLASRSVVIFLGDAS